MNIPRPPDDWAEAAECRGTDPAWFYANPGQYYSRLRWTEFCPGCVVRADCLAEGIRGEENWGVWGGLTPDARFNLVRLLETGACTWDHIVKAFNKPDPRI